MEGKATPDQAGTRILIVDDERSIRMLLRTVLARQSGYELHEASDGSEAKDILSREPMDLVITDLRMPDTDGLALMQWAQQNCPDPTWIILSGHGTFDDAVRAVQLGAFDFIAKPLVAVDALLVTVRNALRQRRLVLEQSRLHKTIEKNNDRLRKQVRQLTEACGLLCDQAETISDDLRRAELIQRALLPHEAPDLNGYAVHAIYRPCHNVGGDLYDVVRIDDRHVALYIADAAGHGVSAAMLAVLFKHRLPLTTDPDRRPTPPAEVLERLNQCLMAECSGPGLFVTAAYCLLDTHTGHLDMASAGHPTLVLRHASGQIERLHHTGPALGLSPTARFAQKTLTLGPGERLLLYTDGLFDGRPSSAPAQDEILAQAIADTRLKGLALLSNLLEQATGHTDGAAQSDDITMLMLAASGANSELDNGSPAQPPANESLSLPAKADVLVGADNGACTISVQGQANWTYCASLHDACLREMNTDHSVRLDFSLCDHLDSTFLGTIQEVVDEADRKGRELPIQGVLPSVLALLEELGMDRVIRHVTPEMRPLPTNMTPLSAMADHPRSHRRVLLAHEALASLNEQNRNEFLRLIEGLHSELNASPSAP